MTTANIIMAVCLIVLMGVAAWLITRYMRKATEVRFREQELAQQEEGLKVRQQALDEFNEKLRAQAKRQARFKHLYTNVQIEDAEGTAPDFPETPIYKKMKSNLGYRIVPAFKDYIKVSRENGKTRYSLDLYVAPYNDEQ